VPVVRLQGVQACLGPALFGRADPGGVDEVGEEVVADLFLQEEQVVLAGDLVADDGDGMPNSAVWSRYWR
jgi:hypothetical protein